MSITTQPTIVTELLSPGDMLSPAITYTNMGHHSQRAEETLQNEGEISNILKITYSEIKTSGQRNPLNPPFIC